jgi:L-threonylcarbamoyladenylate synthase
MILLSDSISGMKVFKSLNDPDLVDCLQKGGVVVLPTDTLYGIVALAANKNSVEQVYTLRERAVGKPSIILVAGVSQIEDTSLWTPLHKRLAEAYWPGPLSLVAPVSSETPLYLHRGTKSLAYRVPGTTSLRELLFKTGPLIAPSANPEGLPPATTLELAQKYFGEHVDGYVDGGDLSGAQASTVVGVVDDKIQVFRQGSLKLV